MDRVIQFECPCSFSFGNCFGYLSISVRLLLRLSRLWYVFGIDYSLDYSIEAKNADSTIPDHDREKNKGPQCNNAFAMQPLRFSKQKVHVMKPCMRTFPCMERQSWKTIECWQYNRRSCFVTLLVQIPKSAIRVRRDEANSHNDSSRRSTSDACLGIELRDLSLWQLASTRLILIASL